jgi:hypothetical protein
MDFGDFSQNLEKEPESTCSDDDLPPRKAADIMPLHVSPPHGSGNSSWHV